MDRAAISALAQALLDTFDAVSDGVGVEDAPQGVALISAIASAVDDIQADTDAALLFLASDLAGLVAERKVDPAV